MNALLNKIAESCGVPFSAIESGLKNAHAHVKLVKIPKRNGAGFRHAFQPSSKLKIVQYWVIDNILDKLEVHSSCAAFVRGSSIKKNAKSHANNKYLIRIDLKNFFPSLFFDDFRSHIECWCKSQSDPVLRNVYAVSELVKKACFFRDEDLPIGYPTSPLIANAVMLEFDKKVEDVVSSIFKDGDVIYTRYADDLVFSSNIKGRCKAIEKIVRDVVSASVRPKIKVNDSKTRYMSRNGGSAIVTGVLIRSDAGLTLPRSYKDRVRLMLSRLAAGKDLKETKSQIRGHLNHIRDIDPGFYTSLVSKYFSVCKDYVQNAKNGFVSAEDDNN